MNRKSPQERARILQLLCEGSSLRSASRIADCSLTTVLKLLVDAGRACSLYQDEHLRDLSCKRIQVDEIWSFVYAKNQNLQYGMEDYAGEIWTFVAICPDTKLVPTWYVGSRSAQSAKTFIADLAPRMAGRIQLTSDGFPKYPDAVEETFGADIDYGMLIKMYDRNNQRYIGSRKKFVTGKPDVGPLTTAHVERQNLTMRMSIKRFARKTNAHSKKIENHAHAVALHFMHYNFIRVHQTLRISPAMAAGITNRLWDYEDLVRLIEQADML